ncbi:hypothetical protein MRBLMI12_000471 [Microbacterium sp. LMI12-1-1.1]|uniref:hypothetical protein n=1 Tax=Microbacterium sp. LMI12-1-1.1 TaxID=3135225 RepID=UPI003434B6C9
MPKKPQTDAQKKLLAQLRTADQEWRDAKETLRERLEAELQKQLEALEVKRNILAYQCKQADIPVTHISNDGLDTSATITAYQAIKAGALYAPTEAPAAASKEFVASAGSVIVTPPEAVLAPLLPRLGIDAPYAELNAELASATFDVDVETGIVTAITNGWNEGHGVRHPVVALVSADAAYRQQIVEWAA